MESLNVTIDNLYYSTVEREITDFYDMGYPDNSSLPMEFRENESGTYSIFATKKWGEFHIRINKKRDGKYDLYVSPYKLAKVK